MKKSVLDEINDAVDEIRGAVDEVQNEIRGARGTMRKEDVDKGNVVSQSNTKRYTTSGDYKNQKFMAPQLYKNAVSMKKGAKGQTGFGLGLAVTGGVITAANILAMALSAGGSVLWIVIGALAAILGLVIGFKGIGKSFRQKRFQTYLDMLGDSTMVPIMDLAVETGKTPTQIREDLKDMFERKLFTQGHITPDGEYLITADETYRNFTEYARQQEIKNEVQRQKEELLREKGLTTEGIRIVMEGEQYLTKIQRINAELPDKKITEKLQTLENLTSLLLEEVKKQPSKVDNLRKLMNYYLPTTEKLMYEYIEMEKEKKKGKNPELMKSQAEIESMLDTINPALETLLEKLRVNRSWDVSSDIAVMNTMLGLEGLKKGNEIK